MKMLQKKQKKNNKGFTLVELIIVIAIIAILAAILAPQYIKYVERSRWSNDQDQMNTLLNEVQTAIVEVGNSGKNIADGTITVTRTADIAGPTGSNGDLTNELTHQDANWNKYRLKNNGNHDANGDTTETTGESDTYVITIKGGSNPSASGAWQ